MVVRLQRGSIWGFSLRYRLESRELEYVSDLEVSRRDHPIQWRRSDGSDPCEHTIYDLLRYGSSSAGLVRGDIVAGTGRNQAADGSSRFASAATPLSPFAWNDGTSTRAIP